MSKHTPPPWYLMGPRGTNRAIDVEDADQNILARFYPSDKNRPLSSEANALLFVAAPDLLRECQAVKDQLDRVERALHEHDGSDLSNTSVSFAVEPEGRISLDAAIAKALDPPTAQEPHHA